MPFCGLSLDGSQPPLFSLDSRPLVSTNSPTLRREWTSHRVLDAGVRVVIPRRRARSRRQFFLFFSYFTGTRSEREPPSYTYTLVNGGQVGGGMQQPPPPPPTQKKKKERRREWKGCVSFLVVLVVPDRIRKNTNWNSWKSHPMMMETKHAHHHHVFLSLWWYYYVRSEIIPTIGRWNNSLSQCLQIVNTRKVSRQTGTNHIESTTTTQRLRRYVNDQLKETEITESSCSIGWIIIKLRERRRRIFLSLFQQVSFVDVVCFVCTCV